MAKKKPADKPQKEPKLKKPRKKKTKGEEVGSTEMLNRIRKLKNEVREAQAVYHEAKDEASARKKELELLQEKLLKLIELSEEKSPLFDGIKQAPGSSPADLEQDDSWKDVKLSEVFAGLPGGLRQKIEDASLVTMNDITEWTKHKKLIDIKGVGEGNATKIEQALDEFWQRRKERIEQPDPLLNGIPQATAEPLDEAAKK